MTKEQKTTFIINVAFYGILFIIGFYLFRFLFSYLFPVLIGLLITIFLQKPARSISKKLNINKGVCSVVLVICSFIIIMSALVFAIFRAGTYLGEITANSSESISALSSLMQEGNDVIEKIFQKLPSSVSSFITTFSDKVSSMVMNYVSELVKNTAFSAPMFITGSVVTIIASCYIAKDYDRFKASVKSVMSERYIIALYRLREMFCNNFLKLIIGYLKLLIITFLELSIGLFLLRVNNPILVSALIALLDLLPVFGTGTVLIPWGIINIAMGDIFKGVGLIVLYAVIALIRNIIEPKIIGKQIGLHPLIALVAVFIGLRLFGFFGMFSVPFTIILIYKMFDEGIFDLIFNKQRIQT